MMELDLEVEVLDRSGQDIDLQKWGEVFFETFQFEKIYSGVASLVFIGEEEMAQLNSQYMGGDYATDVLSFPVDGTHEIPEGAPRVLGDVMVCPTVAVKQAKEHGWSQDSEMCLLVVHGVLHLLGHDHQETTERQIMREAEAKHMARYGLDHKVFDD